MEFVITDRAEVTSYKDANVYLFDLFTVHSQTLNMCFIKGRHTRRINKLNL